MIRFFYWFGPRQEHEYFELPSADLRDFDEFVRRRGLFLEANEFNKHNDMFVWRLPSGVDFDDPRQPIKRGHLTRWDHRAISKWLKQRSEVNHV